MTANSHWHLTGVLKVGGPEAGGEGCSPQEELGVVHPLVDEVCGEGLGAVGEVHVVERVEEQSGAVVQSRDGHLQTHGPQLVGLHAPHQTFQDGLHEQRDALRTDTHQKVTQNPFFLFFERLTLGTKQCQ